MKTKILILATLLITIGFSCKPKTTAEPNPPAVTVQIPDYQKMIIAKVYIKSGSEAEFITAAQEMIINSNKEEGCLGYMLYQDPYEKTNFVFVEKYKNQAAVDAHFATPYFKGFGGKIGNLTSKPTEIKIIDVAGEK
jgi:quinol monooxygenase YgiN